MALIEMDFATGGEKFIETVLWTNPSPTSIFSASTINLSQDVTNFDYIGCEFYYSTSSQSKLMKTMISIDSLEISTGLPDGRLTLGAFLDSANFARAISIQQNTAYIYDSTLGAAYNAYTIPYRILGLKKGNGSGGNAVAGTFNGGAYTTTDTVTLGFKPIKLMVWGSSGANSVVEILSPEDGIDYEKHIAANGTYYTDLASTYITFTDTGFTYKKPSASIYSNLVCYYIAYNE